MERSRLVNNFRENSECDFSVSDLSVMAINLIYLVFGVALTVIGYLLNSTVSSYLELFNAKLSFSIVLIALGCLLIVTALVGFMVVFTRHQFYIVIFIFLMLVVFVMQFIAVNNGPELTKNANFKIDVNETLQKYQFNNNMNSDTLLIDNMQQRMSCCGIYNVSDWQKFLKHSPPVSCCKQVVKNCSANVENLFENSCFDQVSNYMSDKHEYVHKIVTFLFVMQLIGLGASCYMFGRTRTNYEVFF